MCGWDYRSSVAAPLSAWFTSAIGPLWNFDNLPFRIMGWTLQVISVIIGMLPAWWMSRNINFTLGAGAFEHIPVFFVPMPGSDIQLGQLRSAGADGGDRTVFQLLH